MNVIKNRGNSKAPKSPKSTKTPTNVRSPSPASGRGSELEMSSMKSNVSKGGSVRKFQEEVKQMIQDEYAAVDLDVDPRSPDKTSPMKKGMHSFLLKRYDSIFDSASRKQYRKDNVDMQDENRWRKDAEDKIGGKLSH